MIRKSNFNDFTEQDFINDPSFQDWIISPDEEKDGFWQSFLTTHPEKKETVEKARSFLQVIAFKESWPADEKIEHSLTNALDTINRNGAKAAVHAMPAGIRPLYKWIAAAVLVFVVGSVWFLINRDRVKEPPIVATPKAEDILPGGDKAILTLADGTKVILDTAGNGTISKQGNVTVIKLNGQLAYNKEGAAATEILYNTISTPRGGQYQLVLADGSKVWLNAASSLRFPTAFTGKERRVEMTGEAYFEVEHNAAMPFIVVKGDANIKVLGTHFNVMAYEDEALLKVTLLQGSVKVSKGQQTQLLLPGQQADIAWGSSAIALEKDADGDHAISWKNGLFDFDNDPLPVVMRQLSRWYDAEVSYSGSIPEGHYTGAIRRQANLSEVLKMLELAGGVHFSIEGKRIVVQRK